MASAVCESCNGGRLKKESDHFKIADKSISQVANIDISELKEWLNSIGDTFNNTQKKIAFEIATVGTQGIDPNKENYSIPSIKNSNFC